VKCVGNSSYNAGTVGFKLDNVDIDSSGHSIDDVLCTDFETAHEIGGVATASDFISYSKYSRLRSNDCDIGGIVGDRVRGSDFLVCQFRGLTHGLKIRGRQKNNTFIGGAIGATLNGGASAVADLEIGDSGVGSGANIIRNLSFIGTTFPNIYVTGVEWFGQANITDITFDQIAMNGADASAKLFNFNGAPVGGRIRNLRISGTYDALYNGTDHMGGLQEWYDDTLGTHTTETAAINPNGGDVASGTTIDVGDVGQVQLTGVTDINTIQVNGVNPPIGRKLTLHFNGSISLLSTAGGGSGTGNIAAFGGDFAGVANQVKEIRFCAGARWRLVG
jgi:hypothetical protein